MLGFTAHDALRRATMHLHRRERAMSMALERCLKYIERCAQAHRTSCVYDVPEFKIGMPIYNLTECVTYIQTHLQDRAFTVVMLTPKLMMISWAPREAPAALPAPPPRPSVEQSPLGFATPVSAPFSVFPPPPPPVSVAKAPTSRRGRRQQTASTSDLVPSNTTAQPPQPQPPQPQPPKPQQQLSTLDGRFVRSITDLKPSGKFCLSLD